MPFEIRRFGTGQGLSKGSLIATTDDWLQVTVTALSSGVILGSDESFDESSSFPLDAGQMITIILSPNSSLYAKHSPVSDAIEQGLWGTAGITADQRSLLPAGAVSVILQPMPWTQSFMDAIEAALSSDEDRPDEGDFD